LRTVRTQLADGKRQATKRISELEAALATSADESAVLQRRVEDLAAWKAAAAERQPALEAALAKAEAECKKGSEELAAATQAAATQAAAAAKAAREAAREEAEEAAAAAARAHAAQVCICSSWRLSSFTRLRPPTP